MASLPDCPPQVVPTYINRNARTIGLAIPEGPSPIRDPLVPLIAGSWRRFGAVAATGRRRDNRYTSVPTPASIEPRLRAARRSPDLPFRVVAQLGSAGPPTRSALASGSRIPHSIIPYTVVAGA